MGPVSNNVIVTYQCSPILPFDSKQTLDENVSINDQCPPILPDSKQALDKFVLALNAENFSGSTFRLMFTRNWVKESPQNKEGRVKFLQDLITLAQTDHTLEVAAINAKAILAGL